MGEVEMSDIYGASGPKQGHDDIGLAENPKGVGFHCKECMFFQNGTCQFDDPRLKGRQVKPEWCCNKYKHDGMKVIVE